VATGCHDKEQRTPMRINSVSTSWSVAVVLAVAVTMFPAISQAQGADPLTFQFSADKSDYQRHEQVQLTLQVKNTSALPLTISFSSGKQYDFAARDANGATIWAWSHGKSFNPNPSQRVLSPGETWTIQETWAFVGNDGQPVLDGAYTVSGTFLGNYLGKSGSKTGEQAVTLTTSDYLQVSFSTNKSVYRRGDRATLTLTLTNTAPTSLTVVFDTAKRYDFSVANSGGTAVWTWSRGKTFDPTPQELVLASGETVQFQETWSLVGDNGLPVADGNYTAHGTFLGRYYGQSGPKGGESAISVRTLF
jgi:hypothetical protein